MTAENSAIENGHIVIRDRHGVARWTSNSYEDRAAPFNVNGIRLAAIQRLIEYRYGGPCDCNDADRYLSAAFNAIALGLQLNRRKASPAHFINWANNWCPLADQNEVAELAARVIARPRRMKATTIGKLLGLSSAEHAALGIEAIYPADDSTFESRKKKEKAKRDREAKERKRREDGSQAMTEIVKNSDKTFCARHGISDRTFRYHKRKGPDALAKFIAKMGITEKLPQDGASIDEYSPLMERHGEASLGDDVGGGHKAPPPDLVIDVNPESFDQMLRQADDHRKAATLRLLVSRINLTRVAA